VRFLSRGSGYGLYLTAGEAVLVLAKPNPAAKRDAQAQEAKSVTLRMSLVGANRKSLVNGLEELPGKANYFIGNDPAKWRTNVPTYAKVRYREVYAGIDLVYYGNQRQLEYDLVVSPGADPKRIVLGFKGADKLEIDAQGDLVLHTAGGAVRQRKPLVYQEVDGVRTEIEGNYIRKGAKRVGFEVAAYDRSQPLVIDPILAYSTYLGGGSADGGLAVAVDSDGNVYVTGATSSTNYPTTPGVFQASFGSGVAHTFVTKLNPTGSSLVYSTYLGGNDDDEGRGIAVDAAGNAYVTGKTRSKDFPTTAGAFQTIPQGGFFDAFVAKLDPTGSTLVYSTYLGGIGEDIGIGIAVNANGNAHVTGITGSTNFPTTAGAFQTTGTGVFVTKLDTTGSALAYSTFLGNSGEGWGIAVDADDNAYVTGTAGPGFPTTPGAFQPAYVNSGSQFYFVSHAFVTKLNPTGSALVYSTYLGGTGSEEARAIAVDSDDNAYVTGRAGSTDFPTTAGAFQPTIGSPSHAFVTKLNPIGSALVYSTYLGGGSFDRATGIAVDGVGNAYVTGETESTDFPTANAVQGKFAGIRDAFVTKINPTGTGLVFSTYLGGTDFDQSLGIAVDAAGNAYVTGQTRSNDFPTTPGVFQPALAPGNGSSVAYTDVFVAKLQLPIRSEESAASYSGPWASYGAETGTFSGGTILASNAVGSTATFHFSGTAVSWIGVRCNVCGIAIVSVDGGVPTTVNTNGPRAPGSLGSEPVFSASGLDPAAPHRLAITVTGATTPLLNLLNGSGYIAVDAFDVTR
jgi:hypothetical protein